MFNYCFHCIAFEFLFIKFNISNQLYQTVVRAKFIENFNQLTIVFRETVIAMKYNYAIYTAIIDCLH